jgi:type 1 glutamine amidotransferase
MIVATKGSQERAHNFNPVNCARLRRSVKGREGFAAECRQSASFARSDVKMLSSIVNELWMCVRERGEWKREIRMSADDWP